MNLGNNNNKKTFVVILKKSKFTKLVELAVNDPNNYKQNCGLTSTVRIKSKEEYQIEMLL